MHPSGRRIIALLLLAIQSLSLSAKEITDTICTRQNDKIILRYSINMDGDNITLQTINAPRIIPSENLRKACKGELDKLKVVIFDRVGEFGNVKWSGLTPATFMVPANLRYGKTQEGFYILGLSSPISFISSGDGNSRIDIPLFIAIYEKKQTYKIVRKGTEPLKVQIAEPFKKTRRSDTKSDIDRITIRTDENLEEDNADITNALGSIDMIRQLLAVEADLPFSQALQMEIYNLRSLKGRITDREVIGRINDVILEYTNKENELKEQQNAAELAVKAEEKAQLVKQKQEEEKRQKAAEEKARLQEEKQQKRTIWMIIGGVILAVFCFIGNAIFKHFRDIRNQRNVMEMQQSLARQAENEASRRSREIIRNKTHQMVNKGRGQLQEKMQNTGKKRNNSNRKSI